jgi:predicted nucleotidyltransferase
VLEIESIKSEIIKRLKPLNPEKVILFGSFATNSANENSDIDLYIVTQDNYMPKTWREKMDIKLKFSKALRDLKQEYDIDLITHTKKMHQKFLNTNSLFSKEIQTKGQVIYAS